MQTNLIYQITRNDDMEGEWYVNFGSFHSHQQCYIIFQSPFLFITMLDEWMANGKYQRAFIVIWVTAKFSWSFKLTSTDAIKLAFLSDNMNSVLKIANLKTSGVWEHINFSATSSKLRLLLQKIDSSSFISAQGKSNSKPSASSKTLKNSWSCSNFSSQTKKKSKSFWAQNQLATSFKF